MSMLWPPGRALSVKQIAGDIWDETGSRNVKELVRRLRQKIGSQYIRTINGFGYILIVEGP